MINREPNRLSSESSPYLIQHQYNPVNWYPWGEEAFEKARKENKPLLISIGYSACHWCHVMERECFENEEIAKIINDTVVAVKVDREERPDVDAIYMNACMAMSGHGGWPLNAFVTPDLKPFFVGTYFPPENRGGHPGFPTVLQKIKEAWVLESGSLREQARTLYAQLSNSENIVPSATDLRLDIENMFIGQSASTFDSRNGGFGAAPKFPPDTRLDLLLSTGKRMGADSALNMAYQTLKAMGRGGMYDQLGGGFYRYSVDAKWLIPHFEKMLYNQALLIPVYIDAFKISGDREFLDCACFTADWVLRDLTSPDGMFYSAYDADSEGEEGKHYVWTPKQTFEILGAEDAELFNDLYDISDFGNFEHGTSNPALKPEHGNKLSDPDIVKRLKTIKEKLLVTRNGRIAPGLDDKCVLSWNALMISALCKLFQVTNEEKYSEAALKAIGYIDTHLVTSEEIFRIAAKGKIYGHAVLEDYAFLSDAYIELYETNFNLLYLSKAGRLLDGIIKNFSDNGNAGFFFTDGTDSSLINRTRDDHDGALPASSSIAVKSLYRAGALLRRDDYIERADRAVRFCAERANRFPSAFASLISATNFKPSNAVEITIVSETEKEFQEFVSVIRQLYKPGIIIGRKVLGDAEVAAMSEEYPIGKSEAYICQNNRCLPPVNTIEEFIEKLK